MVAFRGNPGLPKRCPHPLKTEACIQMWIVRSLIFLLLVFVACSVRADKLDFNQSIRPLLNSCLTCHGPDEEERAAGLRLDTQTGSREDLGGYAAIKPGDPSASELIERLVTDDADMHMPPPGKGRQLTKDEIDLLRQWIREGANYDVHWSYKLPVRPELPATKMTAWSKNAIDHFTLAKMEAAGLKPSPEADRLTLARRVAIDLTGLPPTWEEAKAFVNDDRQNAYEIYVDQQLAKKTFGERWARVWLDLARYADSAGYADDPPRTIWAFRDYVIRSLNENKPFDQFTIEQIAGDLLADPTEEQLIATAFHRNTLTNNEGGTNDEEFRNVAVVDRVNTTMAVWMGTTMACAQCHTHKYDPITHDEYFQFFAFFNNSEDADKRDERPLVKIWSDQQKQRKANLEAEIAGLKKRITEPSDAIRKAHVQWLTSVGSQPAWTITQPLSAIGEKRKLRIADEGWVVAETDEPDKDTYTLRLQTKDATKLTGVRIDVPEAQKDNFVISQIQASWQPVGSGQDRSSVDAKYVRVELPGKDKLLHLAELQAFSKGKNIALAGKPSQSTTGYGGEAKFINDGITEGNFYKATGTHTANGDKTPWIEIDFGSVQSINRIVLWNRTDNDQIIERLKGYRIQLLDAQHKVVWEQQPSDIPRPRTAFMFDGKREISFAAAFADHEQSGFPASSVLGTINAKSGWAVAPKVGQPHSLTLITRSPVKLSSGILTLKIRQSSVHEQHLLNRFRISLTSDASVNQWAKMPTKIQTLVRKDSSSLSAAERKLLMDHYLKVSPQLQTARQQLAQKEKALAGIKPYTTVPVMRQLDPKKYRKTNVQIRGNYLSKGNEVSVGTPRAFHALPADAKPDRLALANWLIDKQNPLTARVIANRHWEQIFGIGIVESSEEFGSQGELPSHPKLLDWLAVELQDNGWDLKRLLKMLLMSATYRQSSVTSAAMQDADPFNRLLARGPRFRVSAEMVRDQALAVAGLLSKKMYGPPVKPPQPKLGLKAAFGSATDWQTSAGEDKYRRGIYTTWRRSSPYPSMAQFDAPNREVCTVRRIRTNTPLQALVTLNDPVYVEAAQALARKVVAAGDSDAARIRFALQHTLIREATDAEINRLTGLAKRATEHYEVDSAAATKMATQPLGKLADDANVAQMAAWTVVCNVILNLDEMFMKR